MDQNISETNQQETVDTSKRSLLKASYVAPAIVTLSALPSFASAGSGYSGGGGRRGRHDHEERIKKLFDFLKYILGKYR